MSNIRLNWTLPPVSNTQRPIQHTLIEFRIDPSLPWTAQDTVPPTGPQELVLTDVVPANYEFRGTVVDEANVLGNAVTATVTVEFDPPGEITEFTATLE